MHTKQSEKGKNRLTRTLCFRAGPGEPVLTHSGGAARQLVAAGAFETTRGSVVVAITVAIHVTVVGGKQLAATAH